MTDLDLFESRLQARIRARGDIAERPFDAMAIAHATSAVAGRWRAAGVCARLTDLRLDRALLVILLLVLLAGVIAFVGSQLLKPSPSLPPRTYEDVFTPTGSLAEGRRLHTATLLTDGRVLIVGGDDEEGLLASAELWDPATGSFTPAGTLVEARAGHTATLLTDGRVLLVGGIEEERDSLTSAELWDPATGSFGPTGSLAEGRRFHTATLLTDGRVLIVGGRDDGVRPLASSEIWDSTTGAFSPGPSLAEPRGWHTATALLDGRVLVVGGAIYGVVDGAFIDRELSSAEIFDPATGSFGPAGHMRRPVGLPTAASLRDGRVLVTGAGTADLWDPATGSFGPAGDLGDDNTGPLVELDDGRVLVIGRPSALWDPATGSFGPGASLGVGRREHTATLLDDGRVLVVGGTGQRPSAPYSSAELYQ